MADHSLLRATAAAATETLRSIGAVLRPWVPPLLRRLLGDQGFDLYVPDGLALPDGLASSSGARIVFRGAGHRRLRRGGLWPFRRPVLMAVDAAELIELDAEVPPEAMARSAEIVAMNLTAWTSFSPSEAEVGIVRETTRADGGRRLTLLVAPHRLVARLGGLDPDRALPVDGCLAGDGRRLPFRSPRTRWFRIRRQVDLALVMLVAGLAVAVLRGEADRAAADREMALGRLEAALGSARESGRLEAEADLKADAVGAALRTLTSAGYLSDRLAAIGAGLPDGVAVDALSLDREHVELIATMPDGTSIPPMDIRGYERVTASAPAGAGSGLVSVTWTGSALADGAEGPP